MENNKLLTKEEIDILINKIDIIPVDDNKIENRLDIRFENAYKYIKDNKKFSKMSIKDIFKWFYYLGVNTESDSKTISFEEVMKSIIDSEFLKSVSTFIDNPDKIPENVMIQIDDPNNVVRLVSDCKGIDCPCSPQREDCCTNKDEHCSIVIPMTKFNEMINVKGENKNEI